MNKKSLILMLVGVFFIMVRFLVSVGGVRIDITNDIIGYILILAGISSFKKLNSLARKSFFVAILGLVGAVASQVINCISWNSSVESTMYSISIGISVVFGIYFTYYFIEALMMEAKVQEKQAVTRNYQIIWFVLAAVVFAHYFVFMSIISIASTAIEALIVIISMYSCLTIYSSAKQLF